MNSPLVSVLTATYNRSHVLPHALDSVRSQTYHPIEHIIIDDGSTDGTKILIEKHYPETKYLYQPNAGQGPALNRGLESAQGDYVAFLDSDDTYKPDHVAHLMDFLLSNNLDIAIGNFNIIGATQEPQIVDYFDHTRTIPLSSIECCTGIMFGKKSAFVDPGGFVGEFCDTRLFVKQKSLGYSWKRSYHKTYNYNYGKCEDSVLIQLTKSKGH